MEERHAAELAEKNARIESLMMDIQKNETTIDTLKEKVARLECVNEQLAFGDVSPVDERSPSDMPSDSDDSP